MNALMQLQRQLREAIAGDAHAGHGLLRTQPGREPLLRVYRHAYRARLIAALRDNFGVLPRAMGDEAFDALAEAYVQAHPSRTPSIRWYGAHLAEFMALREALVPHPAYIDLARMEWALRAAFDSADAPVLWAETLAQLPTDAWASLLLTLHPTLRVLQMDWAIEPAWKALQDEADSEPGLPEPQRQPHALLVWRVALDTRWRSASGVMEAVLLQAVAEGLPFASLCERAAQAVGDAQATATVVGLLQQWLADGLLADGRPADGLQGSG
jgi:hypothetical protein